MSRTQIQTLVVVLLLVAFAGIWVTTQKSSQKLLEPARAATPAPSVEEAPPAAVESSSSDPEVTHPPVDETPIHRDPYAHPSLLKEVLEQREQERRKGLQQRAHGWTPTPESTPVQMPSLTLQGIFWGIPRPQAIINRKIVSVGDTVEQTQVVAVTREGVTVSYNGEERELKLPPLGSKNLERGGQTFE